MNALNEKNILTDHGPVNREVIALIERTLGVKLPTDYVGFIAKHNVAFLKEKNCFEYFNQNIKQVSSTSLHFDDIRDVVTNVWMLSSLSTDFKNDPDPNCGYHYFPKWLVPFCSDGDCICFDYRNDPMEWLPFVMWHHEAKEGQVNVLFFASSFENFIEILHESRDQ